MYAGAAEEVANQVAVLHADNSENFPDMQHDRPRSPPVAGHSGYHSCYRRGLGVWGLGVCAAGLC